MGTDIGGREYRRVDAGCASVTVAFDEAQECRLFVRCDGCIGAPTAARVVGANAAGGWHEGRRRREARGPYRPAFRFSCSRWQSMQRLAVGYASSRS